MPVAGGYAPAPVPLPTGVPAPVAVSVPMAAERSAAMGAAHGDTVSFDDYATHLAGKATVRLAKL